VNRLAKKDESGVTTQSARVREAKTILEDESDFPLDSYSAERKRANQMSLVRPKRPEDREAEDQKGERGVGGVLRTSAGRSDRDLAGKIEGLKEERGKEGRPI